jgi:hypothetical protein
MPTDPVLDAAAEQAFVPAAAAGPVRGATLRLLLGRQALRDADSGEQPLPGLAADAIDTHLRARTGSSRRRAIDLHLTAGWTRLLLLPWHAQLTGMDRWRNVARARFEEQFGEDAAPWQFQPALDCPGRERLAVAWPAALGDILRGHAAVRSVRLDILEQLQALLKREPALSGCVAELEGDALLVLFIAQGRLRRIRSCRLGQPAELASALRTEWAGLAAAGIDVPAAARLLALSSPLPQRDVAQARSIAAQCAELGFARSVSLPVWA